MIEIIMPKAGMDMQEGEILEWKVNEGDFVERGDIILEIMTDKVNMEVEAEESGYLLKKLYNEGDVVPVITTIGYLGEKDEKVPDSATPAQAAAAPVEDPKPAQAAQAVAAASDEANKSSYVNDGDVRATPAARKAARDEDIDLSQVKGSGPKGRIHLDDVLEFLKSGAVKSSPLAKAIMDKEGIDPSLIAGSGVGGKIMKEDVEAYIASLNAPKAPEASGAAAKAQEDRIVVEPMSPIRKVIAKRMVESFSTTPTFTLHMDVDMTSVKKLVKDVRPLILDKTDLKLTVTDVILMATAKALVLHPTINASVSDDQKSIIYHNYVDLAMAVDAKHGLVTPVIRDADKLSLSELVVQTKDLAKRGVDNKLKPDELAGSTFTVSNLGMFGVSHFNPIINQPNSAILGVSATKDMPVVVDGEVVVRPMMNISLTVDHRIIDGVCGSKFLLELKGFLENPFKLLV